MPNSPRTELPFRVRHVSFMVTANGCFICRRRITFRWYSSDRWKSSKRYRRKPRTCTPRSANTIMRRSSLILDLHIMQLYPNFRPSSTRWSMRTGSCRLASSPRETQTRNRMTRRYEDMPYGEQDSDNGFVEHCRCRSLGRGLF